MKKKRLIPVLLLRNDWDSDELIYIDITRDGVYDMNRDDKKHPNRANIVDIVRDVSKFCSMPLTFGGNIRTIEDIAVRVSNGADKVSINTKPLDEPGFITQAAKEFGSQAIVVCMDVKKIDNKYRVMRDGGKNPTPHDPIHWAKQIEELGAGEILVQCVDRDGTMEGYDLELMDNVAAAVKVPVIALGGAGDWEHFGEALQKTRIDAVAAANIFHYRDQSMYLAKTYLHENGFNTRPPALVSLKREL